MGHVVGEIYSKVGFGGHFSSILVTKQANFTNLAVFFKKKNNSLTNTPFYDKIVPEFQLGKLQIQQNLKPKINPVKLTTKTHLIDP